MQVPTLSERLRADGLETRLDQYVNGAPVKGWPRWMLNQLDVADFVLVVCTETYYRRFRGYEESGKGKGVDWEGVLITQELYDTRGTTLKFVPVMLESRQSSFIPEPLRGLTHYTVTSEVSYQALYDFLLDQAGVEPGTVGEVKMKPRQTASALTFDQPPSTDPARRLADIPVIPSYRDEKTRELSRSLDNAFELRDRLKQAGKDVTDINETILKLKRRIREGGQLSEGDFLLDGRFLLLETIGRGGFAQVWKAYDKRTAEQVAVKVLHGQHTRNEHRRDRFFRGARHMARLQHPGIVQVLEEKCEDGGYHFFVMEYVAGGDLREAVKANRLSQEERLRIILDVGDALTFAHKKGVVHRDVKPGNILLDRENRPKLTDFDLVRAADTTGGTRTTGLGTFLYAAPEAMMDAKEAAAPADVYGLGMTAVFAFHGADLPPDVLWELPEFVEKLEVPKGCRKAIQRAVARKVEGRWASVGELCHALRDGLSKPVPTVTHAKPSATEPQSEAEAAIEEALERAGDWQERSKAYQQLPERIGDADRCLQLIDQLRRDRRNGNDLYFLDHAAWAVAERWPDFASSAQQVRSQLYDHVPPPGDPRRLFSWRRPDSAEADLWCRIPEGGGWIGESPRHQVEVLRPFWLSAVPVTNALYAAFDDSKAFQPWHGVATDDLAEHPRVDVTWYEAMSFCRWLATQPGFADTSPSLPEEEVWEYACRAGSETRFWAGDEEEQLAEFGWYDANSDGRTHRVGYKPANDLGLYDVHGNVWEWTATEFDSKRYRSRTEPYPVDPAALSTDLAASPRVLRVLRGGSFWDTARRCRTAYRLIWDPGFVIWGLGFRVLLSSGPSRP